jgi:GT2 family glycosyltransferase
VTRPAVDVVVPFVGASERLGELAARLRRLELRPDDTVLIVDNNERPLPLPAERPEVLWAGERPTPGYARNRGAEAGSNEWLVFLDADVIPEPDLLDRLFDPLPGERTALLAGDIADAEVPPGGPAMGRWAYMRRLSEQANTYRQARPWPQTANVACRRVAFEEVGGFREEVRAAEDADLTYRLERAGWGLERRGLAVVTHVNRAGAVGFARQKLVHGAGGAWLEREYPGSLPAQRLPGLLWWGLRYMVRGLCVGARTRSRDRALWAFFRPLELIAYELGRRRSNLRPPRS